MRKTFESGKLTRIQPYEDLYVKCPCMISDGLAKSRKTVTPAKAGVHNILECLDSRFRGNDRKEATRTFYERIIFGGNPKNHITEIRWLIKH